MFFGKAYPIVPLSVVPIDDSLCNGSMVVTPTPLPPPTRPTQPKMACEAANLLASEVPMQAQLPIFDATVACANFPNCSSVHCSAVYQCNNYSGKLYFLPCKNPPGVRLVLDYNSRAVHVDHLINRKTTVPFVIPGLTVDIIVPLIHQMDGSLLFAVRRLHAVERCMCCTMLVWGVISVVAVKQDAEHTSFVLAEIATPQPLCVWLLHEWHAVYMHASVGVVGGECCSVYWCM